jgi:ComF family protein
MVKWFRKIYNLSMISGSPLDALPMKASDSCKIQATNFMKKIREKFGVNHLRPAALAIKQAVFPTRCLACGSLFRVRRPTSEEPFPDNMAVMFKQLIAPFLCSSCSFGFVTIKPPLCPWCGIMYKSRQGEDHICDDCMTSPKRFRIARSVGIYQKALMNAIHCFKYKEKIQLARPLGTILFSSFARHWDTNGIDAIVPVPLHHRKLKVRGFNPSLLMVRSWKWLASTRPINLLSPPVVRDALVKIKWTIPQTGLARKKRKQNVKNSFAIKDSSRIEGRRILLVDDVYTTGATTNECAKVLLKSGARYVDVLTLARTMRS